ncbi:gephyrin-like molybdotransferase Glp [Candidatus Thiothrix sp. Deng01]|uniref:Molybdopterin molybdenumtransferase n=1 Tax=Candidatus Thiothrix phosphatis TaxID=3112415 RepID=A0ABU6CUW0_9GAMM|nr:gephyrin-like molybdotransferase Glp [Candidatus Thiothrix sp. Deng01]MEB4590168.1 gephyrin-like molybdotransferase Glp [Candidatus Thiothrix sp. Deng01]
MSNVNNTPSSVSCDAPAAGVLTQEQAQERILAAISPLQACERVGLRQASGRILAHGLTARIAVPPHRNSAMDGYALRHADLASGQMLRVIGSSFAGHPFSGTVQAGECVRIMTGAVAPEGADSVVMQENVQRDGDSIRVLSKVKPGEHIRHPGEDLQPGDAMLAAGRKLNAADLGLLASQGFSEVDVIRRPRVAFCSTGDELKGIGETLQTGEIYDSNRYTLYGMLQQLDVDIIDMGVARDTPAAVEHTFRQASQMADIFITSGGVSVGEADFVTATLRQLGQVDFWKIAIKPGKPLAFGTLGNCCFFGLPGNPVSVMATFILFVRPAILRMRGESLPVTPEFPAICETPLKKAPGRKDFQRGVCERDANGQWRVRSTGGQGSHILRSMSQANCFIALPQEWGNVEAGATVPIIPFAGLL